MRWIGYVGIYPPRYHRIPRSSRCMNSEYAIMRKLVYAFEKGRNLVTSPNLSASPPFPGAAVWDGHFCTNYFRVCTFFGYYYSYILRGMWLLMHFQILKQGLPCNVTVSRISEALSRWTSRECETPSTVFAICSGKAMQKPFSAPNSELRESRSPWHPQLLHNLGLAMSADIFRALR